MVAQVTRNVCVVTTATYVIPVANLRLLSGETNRQGITSQYSIELLNSLDVANVMRLDSGFVANLYN